MNDLESRRQWPRIILTLNPEDRHRLDSLARAHYRDPKREALRLLMEGLDREAHAVKSARGSGS